MLVSNITRMTDRWVRAASVEKGRKEFADAIIPGLRLRVPPRAKSRSVMTRASGRQQRIAIGEFP
jgi:hypothetical protein